MNEATKPGYKTSELYVTVVSMLLTFLAMKGIIQASDINPLLQAFIVIYAGGAGVLTIVHIANKYLQSRTSLKLKQLDLQTPAQTTP